MASPAKKREGCAKRKAAGEDWKGEEVDPCDDDHEEAGGEEQDAEAEEDIAGAERAFVISRGLFQKLLVVVFDDIKKKEGQLAAVKGITRGATRAIHAAAEVHSKRLFSDGHACATMIRGKKNLKTSDIKNSMARGAKGDLREHLAEDHSMLPEVFLKLSPYLLKKISKSQFDNMRLSAAAKAFVPRALYEFMTKITQRAMQETAIAERKRISSLDVMTALRVCSRTVM